MFLSVSVQQLDSHDVFFMRYINKVNGVVLIKYVKNKKKMIKQSISIAAPPNIISSKCFIIVLKKKHAKQ